MLDIGSSAKALQPRTAGDSEDGIRRSGDTRRIKE
jgi:hypothetical protein